MRVLGKEKRRKGLSAIAKSLREQGIEKLQHNGELKATRAAGSLWAQ